MNLSPEERTIGKENFNAAIGSELTRANSSNAASPPAAVSGAGLGGLYFGYEKMNGDPVRVGFIGTGDEGSVLIGAETPSYIQVVAIADIRPYNVHRAFHGDHSSDSTAWLRPGLMTKYGWKTEDEAEEQGQGLRHDYHELLKDDPSRSRDHRAAVAPA